MATDTNKRADQIVGIANRARRENHLNPNNHAYWEERGYDQRPLDWEEEYKRIRKIEREQRDRFNWLSNLR